MKYMTIDEINTAITALVADTLANHTKVSAIPNIDNVGKDIGDDEAANKAAFDVWAVSVEISLRTEIMLTHVNEAANNVWEILNQDITEHETKVTSVAYETLDKLSIVAEWIDDIAAKTTQVAYEASVIIDNAIRNDYEDFVAAERDV